MRQNKSINEKEYIFFIEGIKITLESLGVARITNDNNLSKYIIKPGHQSRFIAKEIKKKFRKQFHKELNISIDSLTVEILGHVYPGKILEVIQSGAIIGGPKLVGEINHLKKIIDSHVDIIDCGIEAVDDNRKIWDSIAPFRVILEALLID